MDTHISSLIRSGDKTGALDYAKSLVHDQPNSRKVWENYAQTFYALGAYDQAALVYGKVAGFTSDKTPLLYVARCLAMAGRIGEALTNLDEAAFANDNSVETLSILNQIYALSGQHDKALVYAERSVKKQHDDPVLIYNLALAQRACGQFNKAERNLDLVIERCPKDWQAWKNRSDLKLWSRKDNHIEALREARPDLVQDVDGYVLLCAALAKEHSDLGEHAPSFKYLKQGADARRAHIDYDVKNDAAMMAGLKKENTKKRLGNRHNTAAMPLAPIFIVGLPRAGSTLIERILGAFPDVTVCGEMPDFPKLVSKQLRKNMGGGQVSHAELPKLAQSLDFDKLEEDYLESVRARNVSTNSFTDKLPMNFLNIGLIYQAMPRAKIIHIHRTPMDACYSIYKMFFGDAHPYSYDLQDIAIYYAAYESLMAHWQSVLPPGHIFDIGYENLVTSPNETCQKLSAYLGLEWREQYLDIQVSNTATDTASAYQVRQPIHTKSLHAWKNVAPQLRPLIAALQAQGISVPKSAS